MRQMTGEEKRELGHKIKSARKQKGLSQEQLAGLVGYKVGTISKYEQGFRIPDVGMLRKIAAVLECSLSELVGTTDEIIEETIHFEDAIESYIAWLRGVHLMLATPKYKDKNGIEKVAIVVDVDGILLDIADNINDIMQMGKDHFKLLAKQFGRNTYKQ